MARFACSHRETSQRIVHQLNDELVLERRGPELRRRGAGLLLDACSQDYRFSVHDIISAHVGGDGMEVARTLSRQLDDAEVHHAFTGLPAAWVIDQFARFRLKSVYVNADPRGVADRLKLRQPTRGSNVQLAGPSDVGGFAGEQVHDGTPVSSASGSRIRCQGSQTLRRSASSAGSSWGRPQFVSFARCSKSATHWSGRGCLPCRWCRAPRRSFG